MSWLIFEILDINYFLKKFVVVEKIKKIGVLNIIGYIFSGVVVLILIFIFGIVFFDYNYGGDVFMYYIFFVVRIWGIIFLE